jgi:superfamily II DNA/RNA helicase
MNQNDDNSFKEFESMGLKDNLLRGIYSYGFEAPSEIQSKAIVHIASGKDLIAQAQSGTGKTGTFVIGVLNQIDHEADGCQGIIIAPVRELAYQIADVLKNIGQYLGVKPVVCVGGDNIHDAKKSLAKGTSVVIGTPGRIIDMIERGFLSTRSLKILVLDEADEMLSKSFLHQIKRIVQEIPPTTQVCVFSATMPYEALELTKHFMVDPVSILVNQDQLSLEGITQFYIDIGQERWKLETFCDLYDLVSISQSMVYVNTKEKADYLRDCLLNRKFTVSVIHSGMKPSERSDIMKEFRRGNTRILISTDMLSRGIDVQQVSIVINFDLPKNNECYIHRIGRSGRYGRKGVAINLVSKQDFWRLKEIEKHYGIHIESMPKEIEPYL